MSKTHAIQGAGRASGRCSSRCGAYDGIGASPWPPSFGRRRGRSLSTSVLKAESGVSLVGRRTKRNRASRLWDGGRSGIGRLVCGTADGRTCQRGGRRRRGSQVARTATRRIVQDPVNDAAGPENAARSARSASDVYHLKMLYVLRENATVCTIFCAIVPALERAGRKTRPRPPPAEGRPLLLPRDDWLDHSSKADHRRGIGIA